MPSPSPSPPASPPVPHPSRSAGAVVSCQLAQVGAPIPDRSPEPPRSSAPRPWVKGTVDRGGASAPGARRCTAPTKSRRICSRLLRGEVLTEPPPARAKTSAAGGSNAAGVVGFVGIDAVGDEPGVLPAPARGSSRPVAAAH